MEQPVINSTKDLLGITPPAGYFEAFADLFREDPVEKYLKELVKLYAPKEPEYYSLIRSIVLDVHYRLEYFISASIGLLCVCGSQYIYKDLGVIDDITEIDYFKKLKVVEKLKIFNSQSIGIFKKVNNLRRAFAHGKKKGHPDYIYHGEAIFRLKSVHRLMADLNIVREEFTKFFNSLEHDRLIFRPAGTGISPKKG